jgi:hypothetical protein
MMMMIICDFLFSSFCFFCKLKLQMKTNNYILSSLFSFCMYMGNDQQFNKDFQHFLFVVLAP